MSLCRLTGVLNWDDNRNEPETNKPNRILISKKGTELEHWCRKRKRTRTEPNHCSQKNPKWTRNSFPKMTVKAPC